MDLDLMVQMCRWDPPHELSTFKNILNGNLPMIQSYLYTEF